MSARREGPAVGVEGALWKVILGERSENDPEVLRAAVRGDFRALWMAQSFHLSFPARALGALGARARLKVLEEKAWTAEGPRIAGFLRSVTRSW